MRASLKFKSSFFFVSLGVFICFSSAHLLEYIKESCLLPWVTLPRCYPKVSSQVRFPTSTQRNLSQMSSMSSSPVSQRIPMPAGFLSLAPAMSASYPLTPNHKPSSASETATAALPLTTAALTEVTPEAAAAAAKRRTSSLSSDGSKSGAEQRFLKLGPVHQGEHLDGAKGDWHERAVE